MNHRLLTDTDASAFVTVFYAILDPATGALTYSNAGHHPPYSVRSGRDGRIETFSRMGIPLGISEDQTWEQRSVELVPGDVLVLYTDGVTDAENGRGGLFGTDRLRASIKTDAGPSAEATQDGLVADIEDFVGDAPQGDDIALIVVNRRAS